MSLHERIAAEFAGLNSLHCGERFVFDAHATSLPQTYRSVAHRDHIKSPVIEMAVTAATNVESKLPHIPFTVGLPDLLGLNVHSRQPAASVTIGVYNLDVPQVEDLAILL
jgi:hypothetical protein